MCCQTGFCAFNFHQPGRPRKHESWLVHQTSSVMEGNWWNQVNKKFMAEPQTWPWRVWRVARTRGTRDGPAATSSPARRCCWCYAGREGNGMKLSLFTSCLRTFFNAFRFIYLSSSFYQSICLYASLSVCVRLCVFVWAVQVLSRTLVVYKNMLLFWPLKVGCYTSTLRDK